MIAQRRGREWFWLVVGALCVLAMIVPARVFATALPTPTHLFVGPARLAVGRRLLVADGGWWLLWIAAVCALTRAPRVPGAVVGLLATPVTGIAAMARSAVISNDLYRYVWDGRIQAAGIDPYRYAPDSPALLRFHDPWLWPAAGVCAVHRQPSGCTLINRAGVHTIYPPLAQLWFLLEHFLVPQTLRDRGYETVGLLLSVAVGVLLLELLRRTDRDIRRVAIWGACPAVAIEAVESAHVDAFAVLFVVLGVWAAERRCWTWAAAAVGAAGLIKLYPLIFFPALVQRHRIRGAVIIGAMFFAAYLPHVVAVGRGITGFLGGFAQQEGYTSGQRYQLLHLVGITGRPAVVVAVLAVGVVVGIAFIRRSASPARTAAWLFTVVLFIATPGEPWEDLSLIALLSVVGAWQWTAIVVVEELGYIGFIFGSLAKSDGPRDYGLALLAAVGIGWARRRTRRGPDRSAMPPAVTPAS